MTKNIRTVHPLSILFIAIVLSCGNAFGAVLIVGNADKGVDRLTDVQSKISGTGLITGAIDIFDIAQGTPTLSQLQSYSAVLVFTHGPYLDRDLLGDILADYVDSGGGVVQAALAFGPYPSSSEILGRWKDNNYSVFPGGAQGLDSSLTLGTIYEPSHPILSGVSDFSGGSFSLHNAVPAVRAGAVRVADWSNGVPLVGADANSFNGRVAGLNFHPPSGDVYGDSWDSTTDGALLMANALNWASGAAAPSAVPEAGSFYVWLVLGLGLSLFWISGRRRNVPTLVN